MAEQNQNLPDYLYRYFSFKNISQVREIFRHNELYFPNVYQLNDPFDLKARPSEAKVGNGINSHIHKLKAEFLNSDPIELEKAWELAHSGFIEKIGILSMSEKNDDILMWSYYADGHKGFCLKFKISSEMPFPRPPLKVEYKKSYPLVKWIQGGENYELADTILRTKSDQWQHEAEWRIIFTDGHGHRELPPESLAGIIFGAAMPKPDTIKIAKMVAEGKSNPQLFRAKLKQYEFGLDIIPVSDDCQKYLRLEI